MVPAYQLVVTDGAERDVAKAQRWYQEQAGLGSTFLARVGKQLDLIEFQPFAMPVVAHGIRRSVVMDFPYNIYYAINGQFINILAIWHGSRDQEGLLSQLVDVKDK